jgi:deoxyribodipyrimidine photo-lyase
MQIERTPRTRDERVAYLAEALEGLYSGPPHPASTVGGRQAALERLAEFDIAGYASSRNHATRRGVSALSPYLRHGVLSLAELRDYVLTHYGRARDTVKFVNELAWRVFWRLVYAELGERIYRDIEAPKYPHDSSTSHQRRKLPDDITSATTGLVCMDESLHELYTEGYMHNHARMWFAAYLQHWRGEDWRDGAALFYQHLLDGDPASNTLSWQWVGSTFSHKPYYFNRQNVEKFTDGVYCARCPLAANGCPFDASYEELAQRLFGVAADELQGSNSQPRKRLRRRHPEHTLAAGSEEPNKQKGTLI